MDTICAMATGMMEAAIGIIRLSGRESLAIVQPLFTGRSLKEHPRTMCYGHIREKDRILDEVMTVYFPSPKTYTREDMVEIHCHGGKIALESILKLLLDKGARLARAGEFTERAFLNGRIDLTQAEAIMDMIRAKSERSYSVSLSHLEGDVAEHIAKLREDLLAILAELTLSIDYPEEDEPEITYGALRERVQELSYAVERLLENSQRGRLLEEGIKLVIFGRPNVGKSSLLNRLARRTRAIVTDIPGTTRDTIEEKILLEGIPFLLVDTAGRRHTEDEVERLGVLRTLQAFDEADLILFVFSADEPLLEEDVEFLEKAKDKKRLIVINKVDKPAEISREDFSEEERVIFTSMTEGLGLEELEAEIVKMSYGSHRDDETPLISNMRQIQLFEQVQKSLLDALDGIDCRTAYDYLEVDIQQAYLLLGKIIGEEVSADILEEVFSRFCVGK